MAKVGQGIAEKNPITAPSSFITVEIFPWMFVCVLKVPLGLDELLFYPTACTPTPCTLSISSAATS